MQRLLKTIYCRQSELFCTSNGQRTCLAGCDVRLEVMENSQDIPMLGGYKVKKYQVTVVLCSDMEFTRPIDVDFLKTVTAYDLSTDVQRSDGIFENLVLENLIPTELEIGGEWSFELPFQPELAKRLLSL